MWRGGWGAAYAAAADGGEGGRGGAGRGTRADVDWHRRLGSSFQSLPVSASFHGPGPGGAGRGGAGKPGGDAGEVMLFVAINAPTPTPRPIRGGGAIGC